MGFACRKINCTNNNHNMYTKCFLTTKTVNQRTSILCLQANCILFYSLDQDLNRGYPTFAHLDIWLNSFRTNICLEATDPKLWTNSTYVNTRYKSYKPVHLRSYLHKKCVTNFLFFQFSADRPWYLSLHTPEKNNDNFDCVTLKYGRPEGNISLVTNDVYVIRWVHNVVCLLTAILGR
jgi:hypothetical protein